MTYSDDILKLNPELADMIPEKKVSQPQQRGTDPLKITETAFASQVESLLRLYGWRWKHDRPARVLRRVKDRFGNIQKKEIYETAYSGDKGYLDYTATRGGRLLFFELKDEKKQMTPEQEEWFRLLKDCQIFVDVDENGDEIYLPEVYLFRPSDFERVRAILR